MFKFIKQYAETMNGIDIYPMISLLIFVVFFIAVIFYVRKMDKHKVEEIKSLPLDDNDGNPLANTLN